MIPSQLHFGTALNGLLLLTMVFWSSFGASSTPIKGVHYQVITDRAELSDYDLIQFFSFSCHHCYRFETETNSMETFRKKNMRIKRIPASFGKDRWEDFAKFYLTLEHLGKENQFTQAVFNDIHIVRNTNFDLNLLCNRLGMSKQLARDVKQTYFSEVIRRKFEETQNLVRRYGISGVPALVLNNKYLADAAMTRGTKQLYSLALYLAEI